MYQYHRGVYFNFVPYKKKYIYIYKYIRVCITRIIARYDVVKKSTSKILVNSCNYTLSIESRYARILKILNLSSIKKKYSMIDPR